MCEYGQPDMHITTIENYEKRIPIAREISAKPERNTRITFLTGDAGEILPTLLGRYDLIFMTHAKGQYIHWLQMWYVCYAPGGILLSDNVLQEGELIESHYLVRA